MVGEANALLNWLTVILLGLVFFYRWHKRATVLLLWSKLRVLRFYKPGKQAANFENALFALDRSIFRPSAAIDLPLESA
jgi:hypothetical protein